MARSVTIISASRLTAPLSVALLSRRCTDPGTASNWLSEEEDLVRVSWVGVALDPATSGDVDPAVAGCLGDGTVGPDPATGRFVALAVLFHDAPVVTSINSQVAGNAGAGPAEVEMMPTAKPVEPPNQPTGISSGSPRVLRWPVTPSVVTV
jgi:hypothetical protein